MQNRIEICYALAKRELTYSRELTRQDSEMARGGCKTKAHTATAPTGRSEVSRGSHFPMRVVEMWNFR